MPLSLFSRAVSAIKYDNDYSQGHSELDRFLQDARTIGIQVNLSGELPEQEKLRGVMILAMRECLTNSVRHVGINSTVYNGGENRRQHFHADHITTEDRPKRRSFPRTDFSTCIAIFWTAAVRWKYSRNRSLC